MRINLSFSQTLCQKCETPRLVGAPCHACGSPPDEREADPARQRRKRLAVKARARLAEPQAGIEEMPASAVLTSLGSWIGEFDDVVSHLNDGPEDSAAHRLEAVSDRFARIEAAVGSATRRRPWLTAWRSLDAAVAATRQVVEIYVDLLAADNVLEAQRLGPGLQESLDTGASAAAELSAKLERFNALPHLGPDGDDLVALAAGAFASTGASDLIDFDRKGAELALRVTGDSKEVPVGMGLAFAMKRIAVEAILDEVRFFAVSSEAYSALASKPDALGRVCEDPQWLADVAAASTAARDAGTVAQALAQSAWNERLEVNAVLALGHALVEGPARAILATIAATLTGKPYSRLRDEDSGNLLKKLRSAGPGPWLGGLDEAVRNAYAHHDWVLDNGAAELRPGKPGAQTLAVDDLLDLVLMGVESLLALDAAVLLAAGSIGIDFSAVDWRAALSLTDENAVRLLLASSGWLNVEITIVENSIHIAGSAPATAFTIGILGAIAGVLRPAIENIHISVELSDGRSRVLEGPASVVRAMQAAEGEDESGIAMAELLHRFRLDSEPIAGRPFVRRWSTALIIKALQSPLPEAMRLLRPVRGLARRLGDDEHEQLLTDSMALCRLYRTGNIANPAETETFEKIREWANLDVELREF